MEKVPKPAPLFDITNVDPTDLDFDAIARALESFLGSAPSASELSQASHPLSLIEWYGKETNQMAPGETLTYLFGETWCSHGDFI